MVIRTRWQSAVVLVPRCARCHTGHLIEQFPLVLAVAAVIAYAAVGQLDNLLGITSGDKGVAVSWPAGFWRPRPGWDSSRRR